MEMKVRTGTIAETAATETIAATTGAEITAMVVRTLARRSKRFWISRAETVVMNQSL
jgi:hypothetical protein